MNLLKSIRTRPMRFYLLRLLAAFSLCVLGAALTSGSAFSAPEFYDPLSFPVFLAGLAAGFVLLCFVKNDKPVLWTLTGAATFYCLLTAAVGKDWHLSLGLCAVPYGLLYFFDWKLPFPRAFPKLRRTALIGMAAGFTVFVGGICCVLYRNYHTPCFDFGLFAQMFYYMKETGRCLVTCERDRLLSHFAVHFSPVYYLLLPVYRLFPFPGTLLVLQALVTASGVFPLSLLCRRYRLTDGETLLFALCLLLYPAFLGANFWYLHENCFLLPGVLWLTYFMETRRTIPAVAAALITLSVKEDAAVYVAVIALYFLFANNNYKCSISVFLLSVAYFVAVTGCLQAFGEGIMADSRYGDYIYDGSGLFSVIKSVQLNPAYAIRQIFAKEKLLFMLQMLVPLSFLPLAVKKPAKLLLLIPLLLVNLMTSYRYQYDIGFQYTFGSGGLLFYLAVANYADLGEHRVKRLCCAALGAVILFSGSYAQKAKALFPSAQEIRTVAGIDAGLTLIPDDADVTASTFLLANLSQRAEIYELESTAHRTQYIAADLRGDRTFDPAPYLKEGYTVLYHAPEAVIVLGKAEDTGSGK